MTKSIHNPIQETGNKGPQTSSLLSLADALDAGEEYQERLDTWEALDRACDYMHGMGFRSTSDLINSLEEHMRLIVMDLLQMRTE